MNRDSWADMSVQISRRRVRCVPDPLLCLTHRGAAFIRGLTPHAEIWLVPEFMQILDSWHLYHSQPALLAMPTSDPRADEDRRHALRIWLSLREETGHAGGPLCWVRDAPRESCLPAGVDGSIVSLWEAMAEGLEMRMSSATEDSGPSSAAMRDCSALATVLRGAFILAEKHSGEPDEPPLLCRRLESWDIPCRRLSPYDDLVALERSVLLRLVVEAGLGGFLWGGLSLTVIHIMAPGQAGLPTWPGVGGDFLDGEPYPVRGVWEDSRAFWYDLLPENRHGS